MQIVILLLEQIEVMTLDQFFLMETLDLLKYEMRFFHRHKLMR